MGIVVIVAKGQVTKVRLDQLSPEVHIVLLSSGKSTRMHRSASGPGAQMKEGDSEFVYHFNNHFNPFRSFLSLHVAK